MKKIIFSLLLFGSISSFAQSHLYGKWVVVCPIEFIDQSSSQHCAICPTEKHDNNSGITVKGFEMQIDKDDITMNMDGTVTKVKYIWHPEDYTIEFTFKDLTYKFKTLFDSYGDRYILKNADGLLITLDKEKK
jgi:hypothetical protein